jgi:hypothetical protein
MVNRVSLRVNLATLKPSPLNKIKLEFELLPTDRKIIVHHADSRGIQICDWSTVRFKRLSHQVQRIIAFGYHVRQVQR